MEAAISNIVRSYERGRITRRQLIAGLTALVTPGAARAAAGSTFRGLGFNHLALDVTDITRSRDFYTKLLGMNILSESAGNCFLGLGPDFLALFKREKPSMDHFCIAIENFNVDAVIEELKRQGLNPDHPSGSQRVYFRDPDGLMVQLSSPTHHPGM